MNFIEPYVYLIIVDIVGVWIVLIWGGALLGWIYHSASNQPQKGL